MAAKFGNIDRDSPMLLPPDLRDWVDESDLVHFIIEAVDRLPLSNFRTNTRGSGSLQKSPHMMLALLIYSYSNGIFSSRKIERATHRDIGVRYLTANTHPDHDTICKFRRENLSAISSAFVEILQLAREMGMLTLGKVSTDGTHIKANALINKNITYKRAKELRELLQADIDELLKNAEDADQSELDSQRLPDEIARRKKLCDKMDQAIEGLKKRAESQQRSEQKAYEQKLKKRKEKQQKTGKKASGAAPAPPKDVEKIAEESDVSYNLTDPDSRVMRKSKLAGYTQSTNAQASVDADGSYLIVGTHLSQSSSDSNELLPAYRAIEEAIGTPTIQIADAGYVNIDAIEKLLETTNCDPYVSVHREDAHNERSYDYRPEKERKIKPIKHPTLLAMRDKLSSETGKAIYKLRSQTVETVFGIIKEVMGFRSFQLRGLAKMTGEWELVSLAYNCKRLHKLKNTPQAA
jgi:transposase